MARKTKSNWRTSWGGIFVTELADFGGMALQEAAAFGDSTVDVGLEGLDMLMGMKGAPKNQREFQTMISKMRKTSPKITDVVVEKIRKRLPR
jgi:hypothetical protein